MVKLHLILVVLAGHCLLVWPDTVCADKAQEATLTPKEKEAVDKLRNGLKDGELYADYMKTDEYLVHWVRAKDLDVKAAASHLRKNLKWRKEEKIDSIMTEDFSKFEKMLPIQWTTISDEDGRPVAWFNLGQWDLRKATLSGKVGEVKRYVTKTWMEAPTILARERGLKSGNHITQSILIADVAQYSLKPHSCTKCIEIYMHAVTLMSNNYPNMIRTTTGLNAPAIIQPLFKLMQPLFSKHLAQSVKLVPPKKSEVTDYLLKSLHIQPGLVPAQYGGKKS